MPNVINLKPTPGETYLIKDKDTVVSGGTMMDSSESTIRINRKYLPAKNFLDDEKYKASAMKKFDKVSFTGVPKAGEVFWIKDISKINGKNIDIKVTIESYEYAEDLAAKVSCYFTVPKSSNDNNGLFANFPVESKIKLRFDYFCEGQPIVLTSIIPVIDLDNEEANRIHFIGEDSSDLLNYIVHRSNVQKIMKQVYMNTKIKLI